MSEPHTINLSTAWEPPAEELRAWVRRFGAPSGLEPGNRVWLVVEGGVAAKLVLNGVCLPAESVRYDVTDLLESRNELLLIPTAALAVDSRAPDGKPSPASSPARRDLDRQFGQVRLEIENADS